MESEKVLIDLKTESEESLSPVFPGCFFDWLPYF